MTRLDKRKSKLLLETSDTVRERGRFREVIVEPHSNGYTLSVRLKGCRMKYDLSWGGIYAFAARVAADRARAEKKAKRKGGGL